MMKLIEEYLSNIKLMKLELDDYSDKRKVRVRNGMYRKKIAYIEYNGNIQNNFAHYIDKPQFFETDEGFCGKLRGKKFWFYKRYPLMRNSFRTVLYGKIIDDHQICYRYGKIKSVILFDLFVDVVFFVVFISFMVSHFSKGEGTIPPIQTWLPLILPGMISVLAFIYPKKEKDLLYAQLQKICKSNPEAAEKR